MFALFAVLSFLVALIFDVFGIDRGHWDPTTFALLGLLFLALWAFAPEWRPILPRRTQ